VKISRNSLCIELHNSPFKDNHEYSKFQEENASNLFHAVCDLGNENQFTSLNENLLATVIICLSLTAFLCHLYEVYLMSQTTFSLKTFYDSQKNSNLTLIFRNAFLMQKKFHSMRLISPFGITRFKVFPEKNSKQIYVILAINDLSQR
jgi:hypothetical protein